MQIKNTYAKKRYILQRTHTYSETHLKCIGVGTHGGGRDAGIWNKGGGK